MTLGLALTGFLRAALAAGYFEHLTLHSPVLWYYICSHSSIPRLTFTSDGIKWRPITWPLPLALASADLTALRLLSVHARWSSHRTAPASFLLASQFISFLLPSSPCLSQRQLANQCTSSSLNLRVNHFLTLKPMHCILHLGVTLQGFSGSPLSPAHIATLLLNS